MKKIIPFNNVLSFNTDVKEITGISLENKINKEEDAIDGVFYITGEYKITDGDIKKEPFSFELPFDIALGSNYNLNTLIVDIDDFRYELIDRNKLKINIDLYIDGEIIEPIEKPTTDEIEPIPTKIEERLDLLDEMLQEEETNEPQEETSYDAFNEEEKYVTYRVYTITNNDNLESILKKYNITKEELAKYNKLDNINPGIKLIIPSNKQKDD